MYTNAKELLKNEIKFDFERQIYYCINNGIEVFKTFYANNHSLLDTQLRSNILGRILNFCVTNQFAPEVYVNNGFEASIVSVNSFNYKVPQLKNDNLVIHFAKTRNGFLLPSKSKYRLEYSKNNNFGGEQMMLNLSDVYADNLLVAPYYAIVSYSIDKNYSLEAANIVIPNTNLSDYFENLDIKKRVESLKTVDDDMKNEKMLVKLKEKIIEERLIK